MKTFVIALALVIPFTGLAQQELYFVSGPCLSPDGNTIVFSYEGDLWKVPVTGGTALRLTGMTGEESMARFSPDGKWIAFTGSQNGNQDVYLMPAEGGAIQQLTFHESIEQVDNWSWDSQWIYLVSGRENAFSGYKISVNGGTPIRLFGNYFHTVHNMAEHPGGELFFSETWESRNQAHRKRYKGSYNPDIQSYNSSTQAFKKYTTYEGKDMWPTIDKNGKIYFVSDEANGEYNLYTFEGDKKVALTNFTTSIRQPVVSADGNKVVFEKDFQLHVYDVATRTVSKPVIKAATYTTVEKEKDFDVKDKISYFDVSPDEKKLVFVSRGELFVSDAKGKFVRHLRSQQAGRVLEAKWMSDNKTILFTKTTDNGFANLFTTSAENASAEKQLTSDAQSNRSLSLNTERTKALYMSGRNEIKMLDLKTWKNEVLVKEEIWALDNTPPCFSPNGEYVMFTAYRNFEEDIFLYHIENKKLINLTQTGVSESSPAWSPDGKYIYFTSNRVKPAYPYGMQNARVYRLALERVDQEFRSDRYSKLFEEKKEEGGSSGSKGNESKTKTTTKTNPAVVEKYELDLEKVAERFELVSPAFGSQGNAVVFKKEEKTWVIYPSNHSENHNSLWLTTYEPFEKPKTEKIENASTDNAFVVQSGDKFYALIHGAIHTLNIDNKKAEKIEIAYVFRKNLKAEFEQMFMETWAGMKENFYNENFHGIDWEAMGKAYAAYLPYVRTRSNLRVLINNMLGELNASHTGFSSSGEEEKNPNTTKTMATGIRFREDQPYVVQSVVRFSAADKKGKDIKAGDELVRVNGVIVDVKRNRDEYFIHPSLDAELELTFKRNGKEHTVKLHPQDYTQVKDLLYDEWMAGNEKTVDEKGKGRIGYLHMKSMLPDELERFLGYMTSTGSQREALILDLRYNTGGNVHNDVLQFLSQRPYLKWKYREGEFTLQPNFTPGNKPIVLLINEQSLSDAEMTATGFKELKLGKIIGMETYRWIIFTGGKGLVDGSFYRLPAWGCYTLDGKNIETNGVSPHIEVPMTFTDRLEGKDPQLDKAIEEIMKELK